MYPHKLQATNEAVVPTEDWVQKNTGIVDITFSVGLWLHPVCT